MTTPHLEVRASSRSGHVYVKLVPPEVDEVKLSLRDAARMAQSIITFQAEFERLKREQAREDLGDFKVS